MENPISHHKAISRVTVGFVVCVVLGITAFIFISINFPHINAHGPKLIRGPIMGTYCQYKDRYYKVEYVQNDSSSKIISDFASIQNNIIRSLGDGIYEIKGSAPAQSVAISDGRYYYRADFIHKTGFTFNGLSYVLAENRSPDNGTIGTQLGQAGSYIVYALSGADPHGKIAVGVPEEDTTSNSGKDKIHYCIAYQLPMSIQFQGTDYYLEGDEVGDSFPADLTKVGSAGSYDIYSPLLDNGNKQITVKFGTKATLAAAFTPTGQTPPASWYNSPWESMYGINADIEWNNRDYQLSTTFDYMADQAELKSKIGKKLGDYRYPGYDTHTYGIYEIKGIDPKQAIAVKNNQVYMEYDFNSDNE